LVGAVLLLLALPAVLVPGTKEQMTNSKEHLA
jgi:hypothetical protein